MRQCDAISGGIDRGRRPDLHIERIGLAGRQVLPPVMHVPRPGPAAPLPVELAMRSAQPAAGDWGDIAGAYKSDLASVRTEHAERREDVEIDSGGRRPQTDHQRAREFHFLRKRGASEGKAVSKGRRTEERREGKEWVSTCRFR